MAPILNYRSDRRTSLHFIYFYRMDSSGMNSRQDDHVFIAPRSSPGSPLPSGSFKKHLILLTDHPLHLQLGDTCLHFNEILQSVPDQIRQVLAYLPPLEDVPGIVGDYASTAGEQVANSRMCEWADKDNKPFIALYQARLEQLAWVLKTIEGFIPDIEMEGEIGVEAGVAVGMVTGSAAVSLKPTDPVKIALKVMAVVPEGINWMIKINMLRADAVCETAGLAAGLE